MATVVQSKIHASNTTIFGGTDLVFDSPVTNGNAVVVAIALGATATSHGASDATNGAYSGLVFRSSTSRSASVLAKRNVTGGFTTVTLTSSDTGSGRAAIFEVSGLDTSASPLTGDALNTAVTNHVSSGSGLSGSGFTVSAAMLSANVNWTPGTDYTNATSTTSNSRMIQYRTIALSTNDGPFSTASSVGSTAVMALLLDVVAGFQPFFVKTNIVMGAGVQ